MQHQPQFARLIDACDGSSSLLEGSASIRAAGLDLRIAREGDALVLAPVGRVDRTNAAAFRARLLRAAALSPKALIVDLARLDTISSHGMRALVIARRRCVEAGIALVLARPAANVAEILAIGGCDSLFDIANGLSEGSDARTAGH